MDYILCHHGILGMKWGVRRFQNEDGSYTAKGRKRYGVGDNEHERKTSANPALENFEKRVAKNKKILDKVNSSNKPKSKHVLELEAKYKANGMSDDEAAVAAYKRNRAEKIAIAAGVTTVAAVATAIAVHHYKENVDTFLKRGDVLQTVSNELDSNKITNRAFYAAQNSKDKSTYLGLYGNELKKRGDVYKMQAVLNKDLKIASPKHAKEALSEMIGKDQQLRNQLALQFYDSARTDPLPKRKELYKKAAYALRSGQDIDKSVYEAFNLELVNHNPTHQKVIDKYYSVLKSKGYGAIKDINDSKYSGYGSKNPLIVFGAQVTANNSKVSVSEITAKYNKWNREMVTKQVAKMFGVQVGTLGTLAAAANYSNNKQTASKEAKITAEYKHEHPNTKLSNEEILRNYYKNGGA